jgi:type III secretory pathway component EscV
MMMKAGDATAASRLFQAAIEHGTVDAVMYNSYGNMLYELQQYEQAIDAYGKAAELSPQEPRYVSNRALALSALAPSTQNPEELLARAIADAQQAVRLAECDEEREDTREEYRSQLADLRLARTKARRYAPFASARYFTTPAPGFIRVYVHPTTWPLILDQELKELSPSTIACIEEIRERVSKRWGMTIPGIRFEGLQATDPEVDAYAIEIMGVIKAKGILHVQQMFAPYPRSRLSQCSLNGSKARVEPCVPEVLEGAWLAEDTWARAEACDLQLISARAFMLRHIEYVVVEHIDSLCGHQATAEHVKAAGIENAAKIAADPIALHALTQGVKAQLARGESIADVAALCAGLPFTSQSSDVVVAVAGDEPEETQPRQITYPIVHVHPTNPLTLATLAQVTSTIQKQLYTETGIIAPHLQLDHDARLGMARYQLQVGDVRLRAVDGPVEEDLTALTELLYGEVACVQQQFITPEMIDLHLTLLETDFPNLVTVARHFLEYDHIADHLRALAANGKSIRDFPVILEQLLR